jgi:hypothetical protein
MSDRYTHALLLTKPHMEFEATDVEATLVELPADATAGPSPASPLPWKKSDSHGLCINDRYRNMVADGDPKSSMVPWVGKRLDFDYIVHACNAHPGLVAKVAALQAEVEQLRDAQTYGRPPQPSYVELQAERDRAERLCVALVTAAREAGVHSFLDEGFMPDDWCDTIAEYRKRHTK